MKMVGREGLLGPEGEKLAFLGLDWKVSNNVATAGKFRLHLGARKVVLELVKDQFTLHLRRSGDFWWKRARSLELDGEYEEFHPSVKKTMIDTETILALGSLSYSKTGLLAGDPFMAQWAINAKGVLKLYAQPLSDTMDPFKVPPPKERVVFSFNGKKATIEEPTKQSFTLLGPKVEADGTTNPNVPYLWLEPEDHPATWLRLQSSAPSKASLFPARNAEGHALLRRSYVLGSLEEGHFELVPLPGPSQFFELTLQGNEPQQLVLGGSDHQVFYYSDPAQLLTEAILPPSRPPAKSGPVRGKVRLAFIADPAGTWTWNDSDLELRPKASDAQWYRFPKRSVVQVEGGAVSTTPTLWDMSLGLVSSTPTKPLTLGSILKPTEGDWLESFQAPLALAPWVELDGEGELSAHYRNLLLEAQEWASKGAYSEKTAGLVGLDRKNFLDAVRPEGSEMVAKLTADKPQTLSNAFDDSPSEVTWDPKQPWPSLAFKGGPVLSLNPGEGKIANQLWGGKGQITKAGVASELVLAEGACWGEVKLEGSGHNFSLVFQQFSIAPTPGAVQGSFSAFSKSGRLPKLFHLPVIVLGVDKVQKNQLSLKVLFLPPQDEAELSTLAQAQLQGEPNKVVLELSKGAWMLSELTEGSVDWDVSHFTADQVNRVLSTRRFKGELNLSNDTLKFSNCKLTAVVLGRELELPLPDAISGPLGLENQDKADLSVGARVQVDSSTAVKGVHLSADGRLGWVTENAIEQIELAHQVRGESQRDNFSGARYKLWLGPRVGSQLQAVAHAEDEPVRLFGEKAPLPGENVGFADVFVVDDRKVIVALAKSNKFELLDLHGKPTPLPGFDARSCLKIWLLGETSNGDPCYLAFTKAGGTDPKTQISLGSGGLAELIIGDPEGVQILASPQGSQRLAILGENDIHFIDLGEEPFKEPPVSPQVVTPIVRPTNDGLRFFLLGRRLGWAYINTAETKIQVNGGVSVPLSADASVVDVRVLPEWTVVAAGGQKGVTVDFVAPTNELQFGARYLVALPKDPVEAIEGEQVSCKVYLSQDLRLSVLVKLDGVELPAFAAFQQGGVWAYRVFSSPQAQRMLAFWESGPRVVLEERVNDDFRLNVNGKLFAGRVLELRTWIALSRGTEFEPASQIISGSLTFKDQSLELHDQDLQSDLVFGRLTLKDTATAVVALKGNANIRSLEPQLYLATTLEKQPDKSLDMILPGRRVNLEIARVSVGRPLEFTQLTISAKGFEARVVAENDLPFDLLVEDLTVQPFPTLPSTRVSLLIREGFGANLRYASFQGDNQLEGLSAGQSGGPFPMNGQRLCGLYRINGAVQVLDDLLLAQVLDQGEQTNPKQEAIWELDENGKVRSGLPLEPGVFETESELGFSGVRFRRRATVDKDSNYNLSHILMPPRPEQRALTPEPVIKDQSTSVPLPASFALSEIRLQPELSVKNLEFSNDALKVSPSMSPHALRFFEQVCYPTRSPLALVGGTVTELPLPVGIQRFSPDSIEVRYGPAKPGALTHHFVTPVLGLEMGFSASLLRREPLLVKPPKGTKLEVVGGNIVETIADLPFPDLPDKLTSDDPIAQDLFRLAALFGDQLQIVKPDGRLVLEKSADPVYLLTNLNLVEIGNGAKYPAQKAEPPGGPELPEFTLGGIVKDANLWRFESSAIDTKFVSAAAAPKELAINPALQFQPVLTRPQLILILRQPERTVAVATPPPESVQLEKRGKRLVASRATKLPENLLPGDYVVLKVFGQGQVQATEFKHP